MPKPTDWESGYDCTWDAWNRLARLEDSAEVHLYRYDGLTRRVTASTTPKSSSSSSSSASPSSIRSYYYNNQWRVLEKRNQLDEIEREYVYNPADRWNLIRRKKTDSAPLDTTHYVLRDFLDPVAIVNGSGTVEERFGYDAFGPARFMDKGFGDRPSGSSHDWDWLFHGEFMVRSPKSGAINLTGPKAS
jgi:uncharacterized protein RhaS with RHS repeats